MNEELSDQMKMATRMGMKAGVEMAIRLLESIANDPRGAMIVSIRDALTVACACLQGKADEMWPESKA